MKPRDFTYTTDILVRILTVAPLHRCSNLPREIAEGHKSMEILKASELPMLLSIEAHTVRFIKPQMIFNSKY